MSALQLAIDHDDDHITFNIIITQIDWVTPFLQVDPCLQERTSYDYHLLIF